MLYNILDRQLVNQNVNFSQKSIFIPFPRVKLRAPLDSHFLFFLLNSSLMKNIWYSFFYFQKLNFRNHVFFFFHLVVWMSFFYSKTHFQKSFFYFSVLAWFFSLLLFHEQSALDTQFLVQIQGWNNQSWISSIGSSLLNSQAPTISLSFKFNCSFIIQAYKVQTKNSSTNPIIPLKILCYALISSLCFFS